VAEDYNVPQISDEQIQEMMKKQQGPMMMQPGAEGDEDAPAAAPNGKDSKDAKPEAKKPAPAKK
jgi:ribosomal protein L12E/L44/L45/RPP1/RPP2